MILLLIISVVSIFIVFKIYELLRLKMFKSDVKMKDKVVIITGSNTGIGYATAEDLAKRGAKVILACRDPQKGLAARDKLIQSTGNNNIVFKQLDLSSFKSVREFADDIIKTEPKLDVLINNAGVAGHENVLSRDNLPVEAQVNHFSPFLLTMLLLPLLKSSAPSRIVNVSSLMHKFGSINWLDKQPKNSWQHRIVYCNTKLANILFTKKLSEKLKGTGVTVNCLHPGAVSTEISRYQNYIIRFLFKILLLTPEQGAQTSVYLAVEPNLKLVTGKYFSNCTAVKPSNKAQDPAVADKLWKMTESIVYRDKKA